MLKKGTPELINALNSGKIKTIVAAEVASLMQPAAETLFAIDFELTQPCVARAVPYLENR